MKRARFVAEARQEFLAEVAYYNEAQPGIGARFTKAVEEATARALAFPLSGTPSVSNTRRVFLKGFPFSLFYRQEDEGIVVFATSHNSQASLLGRSHPWPLTRRSTRTLRQEAWLRAG